MLKNKFVSLFRRETVLLNNSDEAQVLKILQSFSDHQSSQDTSFIRHV